MAGAGSFKTSAGRADGHLLLMWSSPCVCVLSSSSCEDTSWMGLGPILLTSVYPNRLLKDPFPNESQSEVLGVRVPTWEFGGTQFSPWQGGLGGNGPLLVAEQGRCPWPGRRGQNVLRPGTGDSAS